MRDDVIISYRGASYEIGRGPSFYGIWATGTMTPQPLEWWPDSPDGWYAAWSRFTAIEAPGTIAPVAESTPPAADTGSLTAAMEPLGRTLGHAPLAVVLLAAGVLCGIVGLFPDYLAGASLAQQPAELVPHAIYFAAWAASALLVGSGGARLRLGALLGLGLSIVTFGFFFADAGTAIAGGAHLMGAGLVLGLVGWLACAAGSTVAFTQSRVARARDGSQSSPAGAPGEVVGAPRRFEPLAFIALSLAALGTAAAFAPSWDSYVLRTSSGATESLTAGNVFSNPGPVIAGNLVVMIALVAVVVVAALWRPLLDRAALLAGAVIPMVAQAISAAVQVGEHTSPTMFGISPSAAAQAGLTVASGLTWAFWIYCAFLVALIATGASTLLAPGSLNPATSPPSASFPASSPGPWQPGVTPPPGFTSLGPAPPAAG
ncbi:MAG: hypothetical protein ACLQRM_03650 [Acidimicrobiales bacterium]